MRLWTLHPKYLDQKGLVACWREGLLAQAVFGKSGPYSHHPQLERFASVQEISFYLVHIYAEAQKRGYNFNYANIQHPNYQFLLSIEVSLGQVVTEAYRLDQKIKERGGTPRENITLDYPLGLEVHPMFSVNLTDATKASWEKSAGVAPGIVFTIVQTASRRLNQPVEVLHQTLRKGYPK